MFYLSITEVHNLVKNSGYASFKNGKPGNQIYLSVQLVD